MFAAGRIAAFAAIAVCLTAAEARGPLTGIWVGQLTGRNGEPQDIAFRFDVSGTSLSGKLYGENETFPITEAKLEGDGLSFRITTEMNGRQSHVNYTGTLQKDGQIQMTRKRELPPDADEEVKKRNMPQTFNLRRLM